MVAKTISPEVARSAARFGALIRERREALGLRQDELALTTGVGRRFVIELEAGKATCQLGKALLVAEAVGLRIFDLLAMADRSGEPELPAPTEGYRGATAFDGSDLPDLLEDPPSPSGGDQRP